MAPSISKRENIRWLPEKPSEPTTTIVVTSPENRFVDIRMLNAVPDVAPGVQSFTALDWAFAGTSSSTIIPPRSTDESPTMHSTWTHWIDSRYTNVENVTDEGDMFPLTDNRTLEKGSMLNPDTGKVTEYEEVWNDEKVESQREDGKVDVVVLVLDGYEGKATGMVVRVGQWCQGVMRVGDNHVVVERWGWEAKMGWRREVRLGDMWMPTGVAMEAKDLVMGGKVVLGDYEWRVVELSAA